MAEKEARQINIPQLIIERYEPKEIVAFLVPKMKAVNNRNGVEYADREMKLYIEILEALNKKMGGSSSATIL